MWLAAPTTVTSLLLLRRFNKSVSSKSCRAALLLIIHQTSFFTTTFNSSSSSSSKLHQQVNNLHTTTTTSSPSSSKFGSFILQTYEPSSEKYEADIKLYTLSSSGSGDGDGDGEDDDQIQFKLDDLGFLPFYKDYLLNDTLRMVGSCNGIICLHDPELLDDSKGCKKQHYSNLRDVSLWNPATRQFKILPKSIPIEEGKHGVGPLQMYGTFVEDFVAFGFDVKNKDYKVFRITSFKRLDWDVVEGSMCHVQVYSLSTDSWRLLEGIKSLPAIPLQYHLSSNHGIYLNGSYFFLGRTILCGKTNLMMLSFDFTKEIITSMQLPNGHNMVLSCMGDKMAVFEGPRIEESEDDYEYYGYYDIWVLNEQLGSKPWTKLHSFRIKTKSKRSCSQPRCISNNGEFALLSTRTNDVYGNEREKLQLFNLVTKEVEKDLITIGSSGIDGICRVDFYKESLVSIMGGGNVLLRWQLPTHGTTYKLNLDAPFIDSSPFGIGLCLTSDTGGCIGVRSLKRYVRDAAEGESLAMLEAIKWAIKLELSSIIIESDSKNVVSFLMENDDDDNNSTYWSSEALSLLREAKLLLNSSEIGIGISLKYCSRSCNYVADIAAKLGREGFWHCKEWTANSPGDIVSSLSEDLGLITEKYWTSDPDLETEEDSASDSGLRMDK